MMLLDVNVLVYAHRLDAPDHQRYATWLGHLLASDQPFGLSDLVLSGFIRVVTHPRVFSPPSGMAKALAFAGELRGHPGCVHLEPGPRHWEIFVRLCAGAGVRGNLVPDAWLAALALETGSEWITTDRDFARFPGLRWRHPLD